jgi:pyruvate-formate lyase-activating enzyme
MTHEELKAITNRVYENLENGTAAKGFLGFHERAAKAYDKYGKTEDAKAARKMADKVRGL